MLTEGGVLCPAKRSISTYENETLRYTCPTAGAGRSHRPGVLREGDILQCNLYYTE